MHKKRFALQYLHAIERIANGFISAGFVACVCGPSNRAGYL